MRLTLRSPRGSTRLEEFRIWTRVREVPTRVQIHRQKGGVVELTERVGWTKPLLQIQGPDPVLLEEPTPPWVFEK